LEHAAALAARGPEGLIGDNRSFFEIRCQLDGCPQTGNRLFDS
jgi:hypothetical protein